jgi:DNA modification methylase
MVDKIDKKSKISGAKGRPMLTWVGKHPLDFIKSFPATIQEFFEISKGKEPIDYPSYEKLKANWQNLLFHGDNKEVLGYLLANGFRETVDLIYIDPPFDSGADYVRKIQLRGEVNTKEITGEDYSVGEQIQYTDIWANDNYLQFMYERLLLLKEILSDSGFIVVHCDYHRGHYIKLIMDEVFGSSNFRNEIIAKRVQKNFAEDEYIKTMNNAYDTLLLYSKSPDAKFKPPRDNETKKTKGEKENWHGFDGPNWSGGREKMYYELFGQYPPAGNVWRWSKERAMQAIKEGILRKNPDTGKPEYLVNNNKGDMVNNLWADILAYSFNEDYPTEKSEKLLNRIIYNFSEPDALILDCFIGSGTAAVVADQLGRRWIGCDINKGAIQTTSKRLQETIKGKHVEVVKKKQQKKIDGQEETTNDYPFAVYKVNDYDLKVLKTEALELVIQQMGITRTKTDAFFEGTLGKNLIKIIDFNHPLTPLDLQLIADELKKRPDENRNVTVVCLGKELATDPWIDDYNKKHPVNKLEVVELRTDRKLGKMLIHKPDAASLEIKREGENAVIKIKNFISPTIIERLSIDAKLVKPKITDFRSMIDVVLIDTDYNGKVFNIVYSDVPEKKNDFVEGTYKLPISKSKKVIAVKIIDMLGEEIIITKEV